MHSRRDAKLLLVIGSECLSVGRVLRGIHTRIMLILFPARPGMIKLIRKVNLHFDAEK